MIQIEARDIKKAWVGYSFAFVPHIVTQNVVKSTRIYQLSEPFESQMSWYIHVDVCCNMFIV